VPGLGHDEVLAQPWPQFGVYSAMRTLSVRWARRIPGQHPGIRRYPAPSENSDSSTVVAAPGSNRAVVGRAGIVLLGWTALGLACGVFMEMLSQR